MKFKVGDTVRRIIDSNRYWDGRYLNVGDVGEVVNVHCNEWIDVCVNDVVYENCNSEYFELDDYFIHPKILVNSIYGLTKCKVTIKDVIFNPPATIILWNDGTKSVVKCQNGEPYDAEKGFALAYLKKLLGNDNTFNKEINKWVNYNAPIANFVEDRPLTIEELKQLDGKKVYIVSLDERGNENHSDIYSGWGTVCAKLRRVKIGKHYYTFESMNTRFGFHAYLTEQAKK